MKRSELFLFKGLCAVVLAVGGCSSGARKIPICTSQPCTTQQACDFKTTITKTMESGYLLYLPKGYAYNKSTYPLILFLHGSGERGSDLSLLNRQGLPKLIENGQEFPFIIVSPQCPAEEWWSSDYLIRLLDYIETHYRVDRDRVYLTGLSMGGFGTWDLAIKYPDRFTAIAPICGGGNPEKVDRLKDVPTWVFHGAKDPTVPVKESQEMVTALEKAGGDVKLTIYPDAQHDAWTATYDNPELYKWFLSHTRLEKNTKSAQTK